jgi:Rod binding domain-containing protein
MDASALQFNSADPAAWRDRLVHGNAPESEKLAATTREFESMLLRQYLGEALKPLTKGGTMFGSQNPVYGYLITDSLASGLSSGGVFGFSNLMQAQLAGAGTHDHDTTSKKL